METRQVQVRLSSFDLTRVLPRQIIPWVVSDASYVHDAGARIDAKKTVFVGALHGMITAHVLYSIMNELYGKVVFVGIDTDKYKYPIGKRLKDAVVIEEVQVLDVSPLLLIPLTSVQSSALFSK